MHMEKTAVIRRVVKLRQLINKHRAAYHSQDKSTLSEAALDALKHELKLLEAAHPDLVTADSPTQRQGGKVLDKFEKVRHLVRQWSLEDAFNEAEVLAFDARVSKWLRAAKYDGAPEYVGELKIDGLHVVLTYQKGLFVRGATRGDGEWGEDVTENLRTIKDIPLEIKTKKSLVVEGEVFMRQSAFKSLNKGRAEAGQPLFANPRNAAAGAIRQLNSSVAAKRQLSCAVYDVVWPKSAIVKSQDQELAWLKDQGFKVEPHHTKVLKIKGLIKFWREAEKQRRGFDFWVDGVVVKLADAKLQEILGYTGKAPRWALALKFPGEETATRVKEVRLSVGRTGKITPVAVLEPIELLGTSVTRASLHNADEIKRLDLRVGDTVVVQKAGDIIPQVVKVLKELRPRGVKPYQLPSYCPRCGLKVVKPDGEIHIFCQNKDCPARQSEGLIFFASKHGLDIVGLGKRLVVELIDLCLINEPADIFLLEAATLAKLPGWGEKSAQKLVANIKARRGNVTLGQFIRALGIKHVGDRASQQLAQLISQGVPDIKRPKVLLNETLKLTDQKLCSVEGLGPKISQSILAYFSKLTNQTTIQNLDAVGLRFRPSAVIKPGKLSGRVIVFTGTLTGLTRAEATRLTKLLGGEVAPSITGKVTDLIIGGTPSSKVAKAKARGINLLTESAFKALIGWA